MPITFTPLKQPIDSTKPPVVMTPSAVNPSGDTKPTSSVPSVISPWKDSSHTELNKGYLDSPKMEIVKDLPNVHPFPVDDNFGQIGNAAVNFAKDTLNDPFTVATGLYGGMKNTFRPREAAPKVELPVSKPSRTFEVSANEQRGMDELDELQRKIHGTDDVPTKPNGQFKEPRVKLSTNPDGTFTNKATGEVIDLAKKKNPLKTSKKITFSNISSDLPEPTLPKDLQGAKPRYNIRDKSYSPKFESDVDRAAYITAQTNPSKRDADYLKFVMDNTGLGEDEARKLGQQIKSHVKATLKGHIEGAGAEGEFSVPKFDRLGIAKSTSITKPISNPGHDKIIERVLQIDPEAEIRISNNNDSISIKTSKGATPENFGQTNVEKQIKSTSLPSGTKFNHVGVSPDGAWVIVAKDEHSFNSAIDSIVDTNMSEMPKVNINSGEMPNVSGPPKKPPVDFKNIEEGDGLPKDFSWKDWWNNTSKSRKTFDILGAAKSSQSSMDISWPLRQGRKLNFNKAWRQGVKEGLKSFTSEGNYEKAMASIKSDPSFLEAEKAGVDFTDLAGNAKKIEDLAKREEQFASPLAENIPIFGRGVRASGRSFTVMGNKARLEFYKAVTKDKNVNKEAVAELVNTLTGRAKLPTKMLERGAPLLNQTFYSPKAIYSNVKMLNPYTYLSTANKGVRLEYAKSALGMIGTTFLINKLAEAAGAKVTWDPTSSDFGKIKIKNTHFDVMGGAQQQIVLAARLIKREKTNLNGKKGTINGTVGQFVRTKLAPVPGALLNSAEGTDVVGNKTNPLKEVGKMYTPLILQDMYEVAQNNPELAPIVAALVATGASQSTFTPKKSGKALFKMPKVAF